MENIISVSELNNEIKENVNRFKKNIKVKGELTNVKISRCHLYMSLKDEESKINVACWNYTTKYKNIKLKDGDSVIIDGNLSYYPKFGNLTIVVNKIEHVGEGKGEIYKKYMKLKNLYDKKGYFAETNKKALPNDIRNIGIITAKQGAALADLMYVLEKNNYHGNIYICDSLVQGNDCPKSIAKNIEKMDNLKLDALIITRGGGSYEDLFGFSSKSVIEAIYKCKTCVISAIGHEVDNMLSDYVADIRAPTPSIAGEVIMSHQEKSNDLEIKKNIFNQIYIDLLKKFRQIDSKLEKLEKQYQEPDEIINNYRIKLNNMHSTNEKVMERCLNNLNNKLRDIEFNYNKRNPYEIMKDGYALIYINNNKISNISDIEDINKDKKIKKLNIKMFNGDAFINVKNIKIKK